VALRVPAERWSWVRCPRDPRTSTCRPAADLATLHLVRFNRGRIGYVALTLLGCHPSSSRARDNLAEPSGAPQAQPVPSASATAQASASTPALPKPDRELSLAEAQQIVPVLDHYLKTAPLESVPPDLVGRLRSFSVSLPMTGGDGRLLLPPWQVVSVTDEGVALRWTIDLGHESGTRLWYDAHVKRGVSGWQIEGVGIGHAHRRH
jgi:hypothetical protein